MSSQMVLRHSSLLNTTCRAFLVWMALFGALSFGNEQENSQYQYQPRHICSSEEAAEHPHHCHLMTLAANEPEYLSMELHAFAKHLGLVIGPQLQQVRVHLDDKVESESGVSESVSAVMRHLRAGGAKKHIGKASSATSATSSARPTVLAHGMGDSCFNDGMQTITSHVADLTSNYATCIPTGDTLHDDTINGYFMSMDDNIDEFAKRIKADDTLSNGFSAIGFSQGNNVIRGYIAKYNDPPVHTFISINGVNAGIGSVPYCIPKSLDELEKHEEGNSERTNQYRVFHDGKYIDDDDDKDKNKAKDAVDNNGLKTVNLQGRICDALMEIASNKAYSDFSQTHSFQANYWRDPRPTESKDYHQYSQLSHLGNEDPNPSNKDPMLNDNYAKTQQFVWILATEDSIVWPREGEQWGAPDPLNPFHAMLDMKDTEWYKSDTFGLKSADMEGKNHYEKFVGNHLQFNMDDFDSWVEKYINQ